MEDFSRKKIKAFVEPLTCTSQLSRWNVPHDSLNNPAPINKTIVKKKIKFGDNPSTEVEQKTNCYDPRAPNDKYLDNDSMNTLKRESVYLPVDFFYSMTRSPNVQKIAKKKKLNVKLLTLIMYMKQMMTQTLKLKLLIIFPCLLMNFMIFHKILLKIWLIKVLSIFH